VACRNGVAHINELLSVEQRLIPRWATAGGHRPIILASNRPPRPGQLGLAMPPWVGPVSTGDGNNYCWGRNGEFCLTAGPVTRTADILTRRLKALAGC